MITQESKKKSSYTKHDVLFEICPSDIMDDDFIHLQAAIRDIINLFDHKWWGNTLADFEKAFSILTRYKSNRKLKSMTHVNLETKTTNDSDS